MMATPWPGRLARVDGILLGNVLGEPKPKTVLADLGFRGVDAELAPVQLIHRGKHKNANETAAALAQATSSD